KKLKTCLKRIEEECADLFKNWKGNVAEMQTKIEPIIEEVFKVSRLKELEEQEKISKIQEPTQTENEYQIEGASEELNTTNE
ncbi:MAG: hypothetical protein QXG44_12980, partial [Candidatus Jordarchaeaceae archaeon]